MINLSKTAQQAVMNASVAVKSAEKARNKAKNAKPLPAMITLNSPGMMRGHLPTPRRLTPLNPGVKKPSRSDQILASFQTWDEQLPMEPEALPPIFGGLFNNSEDKIIP